MIFEEAKKILDEVAKVPYPKLNILEKDLEFANRLYNDFSGKVSEMTAIMQYIYQQICLKENKEVSKVLLEIAEVEMRHFEIIGSMIKSLGRQPYYIYDKRCQAWDSTNICYQIEDVISAMYMNIDGENMAIAAYTKDKDCTHNESMKAMFDRIIMDERSHIVIFNLIIKYLKERNI